MMSKKAVVILGSPGTGKTTLARNLAKHFNVEYIDISKLAEETGFILGVDQKRDTKIADIDRLVTHLLQKIAAAPKGIIVEGHYADIIPSKDVSVAIVLRTSPETLSLKLKNRGWKEVHDSIKKCEWCGEKLPKEKETFCSTKCSDSWVKQDKNEEWCYE